MRVIQTYTKTNTNKCTTKATRSNKETRRMHRTERDYFDMNAKTLPISTHRRPLMSRYFSTV